MKALETTLPTGFAPAEPWPSRPRVEVRTARSPDVLVPVGGEGEKVRFWALNPYSGCEFACVWCKGREAAAFRDADPRLFERDIHARVNAQEALLRALRSGGLVGAPLLLGTSCDPWQPAEQKAGVTRAALDVLARYGAGVELRAQTRSTLVPRDLDLLLALGRKGKVSVSFSLPTLDLKLARLLEPLAPSPDRRLVALETLARAGVRVGVQVAPVLSGLNDAAAELEAVLRRARDAGASFAAATPLSMGAAARARIVGFVSRFDPEKATRYDRVLARSVEADPRLAGRLEASFADLCARLRLDHAPAPRPRRAPAASAGPLQLALF